MTTIAEFLLAGLGHEGSREELLDLLDLSQLEAYGEAIGAAFAESFGEAAEDAGAPGKDGAPRAPQPSRGEPGTTQQPSPSDEAMNSSGA